MKRHQKHHQSGLITPDPTNGSEQDRVGGFDPLARQGNPPLCQTAVLGDKALIRTHPTAEAALEESRKRVQQIRESSGNA